MTWDMTFPAEQFLNNICGDYLNNRHNSSGDMRGFFEKFHRTLTVASQESM